MERRVEFFCFVSGLFVAVHLHRYAVSSLLGQHLEIMRGARGIKITWIVAVTTICNYN